VSEESTPLRALVPQVDADASRLGCTHWSGAAKETTNHDGLDEVAAPVASATGVAARNAAHLAASLRSAKFPAYQ
jgi:hypothetical protein